MKKEQIQTRKRKPKSLPTGGATPNSAQPGTPAGHHQANHSHGGANAGNNNNNSNNNNNIGTLTMGGNTISAPVSASTMFRHNALVTASQQQQLLQFTNLSPYLFSSTAHHHTAHHQPSIVGLSANVATTGGVLATASSSGSNRGTTVSMNNNNNNGTANSMGHRQGSGPGHHVQYISHSPFTVNDSFGTNFGSDPAAAAALSMVKDAVAAATGTNLHHTIPSTVSSNIQQQQQQSQQSSTSINDNDHQQQQWQTAAAAVAAAQQQQQY